MYCMETVNVLWRQPCIVSSLSKYSLFVRLVFNNIAAVVGI